MRKILFFIFLVTFSATAQELEVHSVDEVFQLALNHNFSLKNVALQKDLAGITQKIAALNAYSPRIPLSYQTQNNLALQKTYVPGVLFGQPEGTYKEFIMGQKYAATFSISPQFDLLNFGAIEQKKSAKLNKQLSELSEKQAEKDIYLQINVTYHNLLSFQEQHKILIQSLDIAREINDLVKFRVDEGIARIQERNEAEVNVISIENNLQQLVLNQSLQQALLQRLTQSTYPLVIKDTIDSSNASFLSEGSLETKIGELKKDIALQELNLGRKEQWPILSAYSSFSWQNLSNSFFYGNPGNGIYYAFVGLRLTWDLPTNIQKFSNVENKKVQLKIAQNNFLDAKSQQDFEYEQQVLENQKAVNNVKYLQKVEALKKDTFEKNLSQFEENILPLDRLLISQNDWLTSKLNLAKERVNTKFTQQVLQINTKY